MIRALALALLLAAPALAETTVRLAETGEVRRLPDELVAAVRAEARATTAAAAQEAVNRAVAAAVARASGVAGVEVATGRYSAWRSGEPRGAPVWQASQEVTLRATDAAAAAALVGAWQEQGLAVSRLGWRLSPGLERAMREEATRLALAALERRVTLVAEALRLTADGLSRVEVDGAEAPQPRLAMMAAARAEAAPPVAVPEEMPVMVRVVGEAVLRP